VQQTYSDDEDNDDDYHGDNDENDDDNDNIDDDDNVSCTICIYTSALAAHLLLPDMISL
jgi:hypothetical protein